MAYRGKLIVAALICSMLVADGSGGGFAIAAGKQERPAHQDERWRADLIGRLQPGDIVFRRGVGYLSEAVYQASAYAGGERETRWTHVGIAVRIRPGDQIYILHAIDQRGVTLDKPDQFFSPAEATAGTIKRIDGGEEAANFGLQFIGRPFDTDLQMDDHSALYCTELVLAALKGAGIAVDVPLRGLPFISNKIAFPDDLADALTVSALRSSSAVRLVAF